MSVKITHRPPTRSNPNSVIKDDRYTLFKSNEPFPIGFARRVKGGFSFWSSDINGLGGVPKEAFSPTMTDLKSYLAGCISSQPNEERLMELLARIDGDLSPENLTCDGELGSREVSRRYKHLMTQRAEVEKELGRKVSTEQVWDWFRNRSGK